MGAPRTTHAAPAHTSRSCSLTSTSQQCAVGPGRRGRGGGGGTEEAAPWVLRGAGGRRIPGACPPPGGSPVPVQNVSGFQELRTSFAVRLRTKQPVARSRMRNGVALESKSSPSVPTYALCAAFAGDRRTDREKPTHLRHVAVQVLRRRVVLGGGCLLQHQRGCARVAEIRHLVHPAALPPLPQRCAHTGVCVYSAHGAQGLSRSPSGRTVERWGCTLMPCSSTRASSLSQCIPMASSS